MSDPIDNQIDVPPSFIALFLNRSGSLRITHAALLLRYEQCEDMAHSLVEHAQLLAAGETFAEQAILQRCLDGLRVDQSHFAAPEAEWVVRRLAELLEWSPLTTVA